MKIYTEVAESYTALLALREQFQILSTDNNVAASNGVEKMNLVLGALAWVMELHGEPTDKFETIVQMGFIVLQNREQE